MTKKTSIIFLTLILFLCFVASIYAQKEEKKKITPLVIEKERSEFKTFIIQNPNYFGTFPELKIKPVFPMKFNTKYEELKCLGFYPETDLLEAIVDVKLPYGYRGNLCSSGSYEYVRFFIDWNNNGDYKDADEDAGITSVNVHDIPDNLQDCLDKTKPISYALTLQIKSKRKLCNTPNLVKIKAILSWEVVPTAGNPDFPPVWGNAVEKWIQIRPTMFTFKDIIKFVDWKALKLDPNMFNLEMPVLRPRAVEPTELKEIYKDKDVPELRFNFLEIYKTAEKIKQDPGLMAKYQLDPNLAKFIENIKAVLIEKPNTKYEQLGCVGLNYDLSQLVATLVVKLPYGYCGNLCTRGSYEYVGFWAYVWDQIEQMCYWKYLGTSSVNVHDIPTIPPEGLQYSVYLPIDPTSFSDKCNNPRILKVRAILSWQNPPPANDPNYNPVWGNKVEALIQIKPRQVEPGTHPPFIEIVGGMSVPQINSSTGLANGTATTAGFTAVDSPFGGEVIISGHIAYPPDISSGALPLKYRIYASGDGGTTWQRLTNTFTIQRSQLLDGVWSFLPGITQSVDSDDYFTYREDLTYAYGNPQIFVVGNILGRWQTGGLNGLWKLKIEAKDPDDNIYPSETVTVRLDNTAPVPKIEITSGGGECADFLIGDEISGNYSVSDTHFGTLRLSIQPAKGGSFTKPAPLPPGPTMPLMRTYSGGVPTTGESGIWKLNTSGMPRCGYVIYIEAWDRTIVNSGYIGFYSFDVKGLCLREKT